LRNERQRLRVVAIVTAFLCVSGASHAVAQDDLPDDQQVTARLRYIDAKLSAQATTSALWFGSFTGLYTVGMLWSTSKAVLEKDRVEQADHTIGAVKSVIGVATRLARPPHGLKGNRELRGISEATPEARAHKLAFAETLLRRNARQADQRYSWIAHTLNIGLNVAGGLIIWLAYDDFNRGAMSAGIGLAVGELSIWTQPWDAKRHLREYERRYLGRGGADHVSVGMVPIATVGGGGAALRVVF
jgi:hypothetical protein